MRRKEGEIHADAGPGRSQRVRIPWPHSHGMAEVHFLCHRRAGAGRPIITRMLILLALVMGLVAAEQQAVSGTFISAEEIATTVKQSTANNVVDQPVKATEVPGGHKASLAVMRRTKAETSALIHNRVTEIYQVMEGAGTLVTV